jgi:signal transduction histidine kinase
VLSKQLQQSFKISTDHVSYHTLKDIQASCEVAIDILNDMLLYDKIESGLLALEINKLSSPWSFIKTTIQLFYVQVSFRECQYS